MLREYAKRKGISFPLLSDTDTNVSQAYQAESIPANYFLDVQGRLVEASVGFDPVDGPRHLDSLARQLVEESKKNT